MEEERSADFASKIRHNSEKTTIRAYYPEYDFSGTFSTSTEPHVPLWASLPFFNRVLVNINPYLKSENEFIEWYGLTPKQVRELEDQQRIEIRLIFPRSATSLPGYLNDFYEPCFPSSLRAYHFIVNQLGDKSIDEVKANYRSIVAAHVPRKSMDGGSGNINRAKRTAEAVFLELTALGRTEEIRLFEEKLSHDPQSAFAWLAACWR